MTSADLPLVTVYGAPWCPHCKRVKKFFAAHRVPYDNVDIDEQPEAVERLKELQGGGQIIPTVVYGDGTHEVNPTDEALARRIGLTARGRSARPTTSSSSAADRPGWRRPSTRRGRASTPSSSMPSALGGQAGISDRIDNYPGFPDGISGRRAGRPVRGPGSALRRRAAIGGVGRAVEPDGDDLVTSLSSGQQLTSHAVIVATGSTYRRLDVPGEDDLIGAGVHFCATCDGPFYKGADEVVVIGGGNSALEEGLHLSQFADRVRVLARSELSASPVLQERVRSDPQFADPHRRRHRRAGGRRGPVRRRRCPRPRHRRDQPLPRGRGLRVHRPAAQQ